MIIHRAFIREVLHTCGAVSVILLAIFLVARLMGFLSQAVEGDISANSVLLLLMLKTITYLDILAPLVLYISTLLVMGRWIRDNELTVISACGIGMKQFLRPAMTLFAVVGALAALFSLYLSPLSVEASRSIVHELRHRSDVGGVTAGVFSEIRGGNGVYFVESYDKENDVFRNLFIYDGSEDQVVVASVGHKTVDEKTNDDFLVLQDGSQYRGRAGADEYAVLDFETYGLRLKPRARRDDRLPIKAMPTRLLLDAANQNHRAAIGELHWRISKVIMLPILMVFALAFSSITYRKNRMPGLLSALLVYFAYSNFLGLGVALIRRGAVDPHLTLWAVHFVFLGFAVFLLHRRNRNQPLLPRLSA